MIRTLLVTLVLGVLGSFSAAQELSVFAASSLTEAFEELAAAFEAQNEGVDVLLSFDGSSTLATQISQGAPADVFASADEQQMQGVVDEGLTASEPQIFTRNRLVVITPADGGVTELEGLAEPGLALVLADAEVPVDAVTASASGLDPHISVDNARFQAPRVAAARDLPIDTVLDLLDKSTEEPSLGVLGEKAVNVLRLNLALDQLS